MSYNPPPHTPDLDDVLREGGRGTLTDLLDAADQTGPMPGAEEEKRQAERARWRAQLDTLAPRVGDFLADALDQMGRRARREETPIPLPWPGIARALRGGLWPGLHVLVGNTGSGKSQFALQLALHAARAGVPVLYVGLELGRSDLAARLLGLMAHRRWSGLWLGEDPELAALGDRFGPELAELPFRLELAPPFGWDYTRLVHLTRAVTAVEGKPPLVVLDYLQLVQSPEEKREDLRERIGRAAYAGRAVARELNAAVLMVSSTARTNYAALRGEGEGAAKGPRLGEGNPARLVGLGKESGEVEFAADSVLVLTREGWGKGPPPEWSSVHVAIAKVRAGVSSWWKLEFNGGWFREPGAATPREGML